MKSFKVKNYTVDKGSKLVKQTEVGTLLDYVRVLREKKALTSDEMWMSFQRQAADDQTTSEEAPRDYCMKFYRKGLDKDSAARDLQQQEQQKGHMKLTHGPKQDFKNDPLWITTSIKHSRTFKIDDREHPFCVAYTVDMSEFAKRFHADKILVFNDDKDRKVARQILEDIKSEKFCWFETQKLEEHEYFKVNLGLWPKHVDLFNECIRGSEMMVQTPRGPDEGKMKRVEWNGSDIVEADLGASVASETSAPTFVAKSVAKEQDSDKKMAPTEGAAAVPGKKTDASLVVVKDAPPEENNNGGWASLNCCGSKK